MLIRHISILFLLAFVITVQADDTPYEFKNEANRQQYENIIEEIRCLVCQNQSLADSHASLAQDLRQEIYEMVLQGKSNDEVIAFLVARYGDFVLYRPPLNQNTYLLWFGPFIFLLLAAFFIVKFVRGRTTVSDQELSEEEQAQLHLILNDNEEEE